MLRTSSNILQLFLLTAFIWWLKEMAPVCCKTSNNYTELLVLEYAVHIWAFYIICDFLRCLYKRHLVYVFLVEQFLCHQWNQMELQMHNGQIVFVPLKGTLFMILFN